MTSPINIIYVFKPGVANIPDTSPLAPIKLKYVYNCSHPECDFITSKPYIRCSHEWVEHGIGFGITYICKKSSCEFKTRKLEEYTKHNEFHKYLEIRCDICRRGTKPLSPTKYKGFLHDQVFKLCVECDHMYDA